MLEDHDDPVHEGYEMKKTGDEPQLECAAGCLVPNGYEQGDEGNPCEK